MKKKCVDHANLWTHKDDDEISHDLYNAYQKFGNARENLVGKYGFLSTPQNAIFVRKRRFVKGVIRVRVRVRLICFIYFFNQGKGSFGPW
jgi:hypothetical protein